MTPLGPRTGMRRRRPSTALLAAMAAGLVHAAVSLYWALGGDWLLSTLGARVVESFDGLRWLLAPVALVKAGFAVLPYWLARRGLLQRRLAALICWLGCVVLVLWGGSNTVVGNLVLIGWLDSPGGYDRAGMIGHARLWDPLFLVWGLALGRGLAAGGALRRRGPRYPS